MNERQLAKAAGVSKDIINKLEKGGQRDTVSESALGLARALRSSVEDLHSNNAAGQHLAEALPLSDERLRDLIADAAEQVLIYVREANLDDDPQSVAKEIAAAFEQMEESERRRAQPVFVNLGGKVVELRPWGKPV
jgi:DNA-binding XRE family transcriptional regulator